MNDFSGAFVEENGRPREIENVFTGAATAARSFDRGGRHAASRTDRRLDRRKIAPTHGAHRTVAPFEYLSAADDAGNGENEIQNRIDHLRSGKAQGA